MHIRVHRIAALLIEGIRRYEAGGTAFHSGAHQVGVQPSNGACGDLWLLLLYCSRVYLTGHHLTLEDVESRIVLSEDVHVYAMYTLSCMQRV